MSAVTTPAEEFQQKIGDRGWVAVCDPTCGAGALLVAFANECRKKGINYQTDVLFVAQDIDYIVGMIRILLSKKLGELKWTQADLARATGIRPTTISDYYNEIAERMNLNHLDLICEALDCSPTEILVREPNPEPRVRNRTGFEKPVTGQRKDGE